jgi:hypothetical protein
MKFGDKAHTVLRIAAMEIGADRCKAYEEACRRFSQKAVDTMFKSLESRGYIESGVSARTGWLTAKGKAALE